MSRGTDGAFQTDAVLRDAAATPHADDFPGVVVAVEGADPEGPNVYCVQVDSPEWKRRVALKAAGQWPPTGTPTVADCVERAY